MKNQVKSDRLMKIAEVSHRTGLSRTSIYREFVAERFPLPVRIGARGIAWRESEVDSWIEDRVVARGADQ